MTNATVHPFERAGLGLAPFSCIGMTHEVGPRKLADGSEVGAPGQPMGTCQYCYQGIAYVYVVRSADGRTFNVGSDCVAKVGQVVVSPSVAATERKFAREQRKAAKDRRETKLRDELRALIADPAVAARLAGTPDAGWPGRSLLSWVEFCLARAGADGLKRALVVARGVQS